jgi:hypothetical protein
MIIVQLKDAGQETELGTGSLYFSIQKKLSKDLLVEYKTWIHTESKQESGEILHKFLSRKAEYLVESAETISGISASGGSAHRSDNTSNKSHHNQKADFKDKRSRTFVSQSTWSSNQSENHGEKKGNCGVCLQKECSGAWSCSKYKSLPVNKRWDEANRLRLCYM